MSTPIGPTSLSLVVLSASGQHYVTPPFHGKAIARLALLTFCHGTRSPRDHTSDL